MQNARKCKTVKHVKNKRLLRCKQHIKGDVRDFILLLGSYQQGVNPATTTPMSDPPHSWDQNHP